jgi:Lysylphosphatidylglycerol synthase TM region
LTENAQPIAQGHWIKRWIDRVMLAVGLGLLAFVITRYPLGDIVDAVEIVWPAFALTLVVAFGWTLVNTRALQLLLDNAISFRALLAIRLVGDGYNSVLPAAGVGGEPFKVRQLTASVPVGRAVTALIRDRVIENGVGLLVTAGGLAWGLATFALPSALRAGLVTYIAIGAAVGVACLVFVLTPLPGKLGRTLARWLGATGDAELVPLPAARLAHLLVWYVLSRFVGLFEFVALLWGLGLPHDPATVVFCYCFHHAAGFISFAIPAGLGVFEGTTVYLFSLLGFPGPLGLACAFARRGRMVVSGLLGAAVHVAQVRSRAPDPR